MKSILINEAILSFYKRLESLLESHNELTDTDVRESIHLVLTYYFVWNNGLSKFPKSFCMLNQEGDEAVGQIIYDFLNTVYSTSELRDICVGSERLNYLQNEELVTPRGRRYYDFIGISKKPIQIDSLPDYLFEEGDYE
ncbi:MAG: hypothetical protein SVW51_10650 [Pseudomonadota bacterium]|nr:hypothetical protein [Pseudomonadota bacterium]